jgi:CO dehydrogenase maturation factor
MLRVIVDRLSGSYDYVVIDNEAGMEHLSRRTTRDVDVLLLVTDPTHRGLVAVQHMAAMVPELKIAVGQVFLVINRLRGGEMPTALSAAVQATGLNLLGTTPDDPMLAEFEFTGRPLIELPEESAAWRAIQAMARRLPI